MSARYAGSLHHGWLQATCWVKLPGWLPNTSFVEVFKVLKISSSTSVPLNLSPNPQKPRIYSLPVESVFSAGQQHF